MVCARIPNARLFIGLLILLALSGCGPAPAPAAAPTAAPGEVPTQALTATPAATPTPLPRTLVPGIGSTIIKTIYNQAQREAVARGIPYFFWPDSNIAFLPDGNQYRFFAPNGPRTTITLGTFDDPGAKLVVAKLAIKGIDEHEFPFASSGSIYRDPESGMLLMFYHAERHYGDIIFHSAIGLAVSNDDGKSFQNLGIILESNAKPDPKAPCCVDMRGATYMIKDGKFYLYFSDRLADLTDIYLALATAPVAEVVQAAHEGKLSPWSKYYAGAAQEPGISGRASPLEAGNPFITWIGVSYNEYLKKYIMAVSYHPGEDMYDSSLYLISSDDGITWSPRVPLVLHCDCWLTYATIISPDGQVNTGSQFYIFYDSTARGMRPYADTSLQRMTVTLTGQMVEAPHAWEFETAGDTEGWSAWNQLSPLKVADGHLVTQSSGNDPNMGSQFLAVDAKRYTKVEINMKVSAGQSGQVFFLTDTSNQYSEFNSMHFPIQADGQFHTYTLDMSQAPGWSGVITQLRLDPVEVPASIDIDSIRISGP